MPPTSHLPTDFKSPLFSSFSDNTLDTALTDSSAVMPGLATSLPIKSLSSSSDSATVQVVPDPGNTLETAFNIGTLNGSQTFSDSIGNPDLSDYYRFSLNQTSAFNLTLTSLTADADLKLLDGNGSQIAISQNYGTADEVLTTSLAAGTYYLNIYPYQGNTNYTLNVSATPISVDEAGNTLATARVIAVGSTANNFIDAVSAADQDDFYRFTITQSGIFTADLSSLTGDADVRLIQDKNGNGSIDAAGVTATGAIDPGEILASQWERGTTSETIRRFLTPGTYYIQVLSYNNQSTNYALGTILTPAASDPQAYSITPTFDNSFTDTGKANIQKAIDFWQSAILSVHDAPANVPHMPQNNSIAFSLDPTRPAFTASGGFQLGLVDNVLTQTQAYVNISPELVNQLNTDPNYNPSGLIHEIGHTFGLIGFNLTGQSPDLVDRPTGTYRANTYAGWAYGELRGTYTQTAVPVSTINPVLGGEDYGHWEATVFGNETMVPFANGSLSQLSLAALRDEGWNIDLNLGAAQPYALPQPGPKNTLAPVVGKLNNGAAIAPGFSFSYNASGTVSAATPDQFYLVNFGGTGTLTVALNLQANDPNLGLPNNNVDMRLIRDANDNGVVDDDEVVATSVNAGGASESFNFSNNLSSGKYYIEIYPTSSVDVSENRFFAYANYSLNINASVA